ncbi:MAG: glutamine synthetase [Bdellovibrionales bacterium]|nr:glutamine synthetase [Bdellovibrionales bacterium]
MNQSDANRLEEYRKKGVKRIKLAITDMDGVLRGKYVSLDKFETLIKNFGGFCDNVFGWDVEDLLYNNGTTFTGWHTAFPDAKYRIDANTERWLPDENLPFFLADFFNQDKQLNDHPVCPRTTFKRVLTQLDRMGFTANLAFEYEFFLFNETPQSVREKNYQNLEPLTPGMFGYSIIRNSTYSDLFNEFMDYCLDMDIPLEGLHCETGPGVWEAAIEYDEALKAVDRASLFKTFSKVFFQKRGILATFMARWNLTLPGQSGHIHQSLIDKKTGRNIFYSDSDPYCMSETMKSYVAGQVKYLKPFLALAAPTINSYTRLVKGFWAPTASTWGVENRTTALRVIPGSEKSQRVEFRLGAADANPYLAATAVLAAGMLGIQENLKLDEPIKGSAYEVQDQLPKELQLPTSLRDSIVNLENSKEAPQVFGKEFVEHFISTRKWEVSEYDKAITDWQLKRYFEII